MYGRHTHVLSCSVMSNSLWPHGLNSTRLLCLWGFFRQEYWSELPFTSLGESFQPGIEPRFPTLQMDSLPSEPIRKPPGKNQRQADRQTDRQTHIHDGILQWKFVICHNMNAPGLILSETNQPKKDKYCVFTYM